MILTVQLLERQRITKQGGGARLLEIIHGPLASHLPANAIKLGKSKERTNKIHTTHLNQLCMTQHNDIALSWNAPKVRLYNYFKDLDLDERPLVIAVGAMAKGEDTFADAYTDQKIGMTRVYGATDLILTDGL
jgi:rRNA small subunit pseudouridine methyltransferase Nep1